jgi:hypothetical protein
MFVGLKFLVTPHTDQQSNFDRSQYHHADKHQRDDYKLQFLFLRELRGVGAIFHFYPMPKSMLILFISENQLVTQCVRWATLRIPKAFSVLEMSRMN